jgi:eukaryotic-like serine/threonine-protein kinase
MHERDLIVGVLAIQAGFVSPSQVFALVAAWLVDAAADSLLTRLERAGALTPERRKVLESLVEQALLARNGDAQARGASLGGTPTLFETQVSFAAGDEASGDVHPACEIPLERPGQYTRLHELGRGSQSIVRVARDEIVGREVALKELVTQSGSPGPQASCAARARFIREVRLVASIDHPGVVPILEVARREDGTLFCAQKLIRGETLQAHLARCRTLSNRLQLLRYVLDACQAMAFAHSRRVIHRDLKPANVMVGEYGETVVIDWGLAKHQDEAEEVGPLLGRSAEPVVSSQGSALGTPAYMSPEQARGDLRAVDSRSDVFSLGAILYHVLTGRPPFEGATSDHILERVKACEFHPIRLLTPEAPPELAAVAERALRLQRSDRYRDAGELATELKAYLSGGRVQAYRYGVLESLERFAASHRALMAAVAIALASLLASTVIVELRLQGVETRERTVQPAGASGRPERVIETRRTDAPPDGERPPGS